MEFRTGQGVQELKDKIVNSDSPLIHPPRGLEERDLLLLSYDLVGEGFDSARAGVS